MNLISSLKKLPIDVGQAQRKHDSAGKRIAFSLIKEGSGKKALDIGCRDGYWTKQLEERGYDTVSLDIDPLYSGAITHDVEKGLPFEDNSFDVIWCTEVIEHLHKPELLISEVDRVLRLGGIAVITTPNSGWWMYPVVKLWGWTPKKLQNPDHKQFFIEKDIRKIAQRYKVFGYFPYMFRFFKISSLIGFLSPTFILIYRKNV